MSEHICNEYIKYKVVQHPSTKNIELQVYRSYGDKADEWAMVDRLTDLSISELKCLTEYLISIFRKK